MPSNRPFLWNYVETVEISNTQSGGQERPFTKTVAEENNPSFVLIHYNKMKFK